jgi:hypothetical protein
MMVKYSPLAGACVGAAVLMAEAFAPEGCSSVSQLIVTL